jgi:hypothetical protein
MGTDTACAAAELALPLAQCRKKKPGGAGLFLEHCRSVS